MEYSWHSQPKSSGGDGYHKHTDQRLRSVPVCVYSMCAPHGLCWNAISPSAQGESVCCHLPFSKRASDWQHWHATGPMPAICTYTERTSTQQGGIGIFVTFWVTKMTDMHFWREGMAINRWRKSTMVFGQYYLVNDYVRFRISGAK